MANNPIGVSFMPTQDNQNQGPKQGQMEGDLAQAFKILSLRLPRVQGAHAIAPYSLLNSPGSAGAQGAFNPYSAVFDALLKSHMQPGQYGPGAQPGAGQTPPNFEVTDPNANRQVYTPPPTAPSAAPTPQFGEDDPFGRGRSGGRSY